MVRALGARAASRVACTGPNSRLAIRPMTPKTASNSISVKAVLRVVRHFCIRLVMPFARALILTGTDSFSEVSR